jgi:hypothetical protein
MNRLRGGAGPNMDAINYIGVKKGIVKRFSGTKGKIVFCSSEEEECSGELFCYKIDVLFKVKQGVKVDP